MPASPRGTLVFRRRRFAVAAAVAVVSQVLYAATGWRDTHVVLPGDWPLPPVDRGAGPLGFSVGRGVVVFKGWPTRADSGHAPGLSVAAVSREHPRLFFLPRLDMLWNDFLPDPASRQAFTAGATLPLSPLVVYVTLRALGLGWIAMQPCNRCVCGYPLKGLHSGRCPECGRRARVDFG